MGAYDNTVAGLKSDKSLENGGRGRVGGRNYRRDYADRLRYLFNSELLVLLNYTAGLGVFVGVVDILRGIMIFDNLILDNTHTRLLNRKLGKRNTSLVCGCRRRLEDCVYLFLSVGRKLLLRGPYPLDCRFEGFDAVYYRIILFHHSFSFYKNT